MISEKVKMQKVWKDHIKHGDPTSLSLGVCVWTNDEGQTQVRRRGFVCGETSSPLSI